MDYIKFVADYGAVISRALEVEKVIEITLTGRENVSDRIWYPSLVDDYGISLFTFAEGEMIITFSVPFSFFNKTDEEIAEVVKPKEKSNIVLLEDSK